MSHTAARRDGDHLVIPRGGAAPDRCVWCNGPSRRRQRITVILPKARAGGIATRPKRYWAFRAYEPDWVGEGRRTQVWFGLCARHTLTRLLGSMLLMYGAFATAAVAMFAALKWLNEDRFSGARDLAFVLVLLAVIGLLLCAMARLALSPLPVVEVDDREVKLRGASRAYLDSL